MARAAREPQPGREAPTVDLFGAGEVDLFGGANAGEVDIAIPTLRREISERRRAEMWKAEAAEIERVHAAWTPGTTITLVTYRLFSVYRVLVWWAARYGPCELTASTFALSEATAVELSNAGKSGSIRRVNLLVDFHTFQCRGAGVNLLMAAGARIGVTKQHAKVSVLYGGSRPLTVVSTANLNENQRIEVSILSDDPRDAEFHRGWMMEEIERTNTLIRPDGSLDGRRWRFNKATTLP